MQCNCDICNEQCFHLSLRLNRGSPGLYGVCVEQEERKREREGERRREKERERERKREKGTNTTHLTRYI